jgi:hypothetical protein
MMAQNAALEMKHYIAILKVEDRLRKMVNRNEDQVGKTH